jgi:hypothetical protein
MMGVGGRCVIWTFTETPLERVVRPPKTNVFLDAFDLGFALRGSDWHWSKGLSLPPEHRPVHSKRAFLCQTLISAVFHLTFFDLCLFTLQEMSPSTIGSPAGGSIFDDSLPPTKRYLRSTFAAFVAGIAVSSAMQGAYDLLTIIGLTIFRQSPKQWPPFFGPFLSSTSLNSFWAHGWHQLFRECFIGIGYKPFAHLFGRIGGVLGAFSASGLLHHYGLLAMGRGGEFWKTFGFFFMMGVGVVLEGLVKRVTGRKVGGWLGWIWTVVWIVGWGQLLADAWTRKGLVGSMFGPESYRPGKYIITRLLNKSIAY